MMKKAVSIFLCCLSMLFAMGCSDPNVSYLIFVDKAVITGETDAAQVTIQAKVKKDFVSGITYGTEKNTCMVAECYMVSEGTEYKLYNDYDSLPHPEPEIDFHFEKGEIVERTLLFSRLPLIDNDDFQAVPTGEYRLRVRFNGESSWTETDIVISAE